MERFDKVLQQLQNSVNLIKIDFELLEQLKQQVNGMEIDKQNFQQYVGSLVRVYELSNNHKLYTIKRTSISIHQMAVKLKLIVCKMMTQIIVYFQKQQSVNSIPLEILTQAIQVMILSARVCLNEGKQYITDIQEFYKFIHSPYEYVIDSLGGNLQFVHQLNILELMRFKCESESFNITEFQKRLRMAVSFQQIQMADYRNFIQNLVMQIVLKSLKSGKINSQNAEDFFPFLSQHNRNDLQALISSSTHSIKNIQNASQFLQIYTQIKQHGIQSVSLQYLEEFIKKQKNFNDDRIFQVAALTLQPMFLDIWFKILNAKREKVNTLQKALHCFIFMVQRTIDSNSSPASNFIVHILKLSNSIILTLLTQKKAGATNQPILNTVRTLVRLLTWICFSLHQNWIQIRDIGQKIVLLCSRYQCMELCKVIYSVMLYYSLVNKKTSEEIYEKFVVYHNNDKLSQIYKILSTAYEFQKGKRQNGEVFKNRTQNSLRLQMKKQPFIAILFAQNNEDMCIFQLDTKQFKQIKLKFYIYAQLLKKYRNNQKNIKVIMDHLQAFIIKIKFQQFQSYQKEDQSQSVKKLMIILVQILQHNQFKSQQKIRENMNQIKMMQIQQNKPQKQVQTKSQSSQNNVHSSQLCFVLINLHILTNKKLSMQFKDASLGVLLNKYSIKVKILNGLIQIIQKGQIQLDKQLYNIFCCYLTTILQKLKKLSIKKQRIGEPGEVSFIHAVEDIIYVHNKLKQQKTQIQISFNQSKNQKFQQTNKEYVYFTIFQIDCLTQNYEKYNKITQQIPISLLKAFNQSIFIPKSLKLKILRRIIRQNFMYQKCEISLKQFKQIIQITEDQEQVELYIKCVFTMYGQQGKNMLFLMANQNKKLHRILINDHEVQI